jgi:hypothetical protein
MPDMVASLIKALALRLQRARPTSRPAIVLNVFKPEAASNRRPSHSDDFVLAEDASAWIATLAQEVQPRVTLLMFPRIVNRLARCWNDDEMLELLFDELLIDHRGGRQGFPPEVHAEILALCRMRMEAPDVAG